MKTRKINTLVFIYNSFNDPLFQNLVLSYIKTLSAHVHGDFHVVTFEQPHYRLSDEEKQRIKKELAGYRIYWHPLRHHTGAFLLFWKALDLLIATIRVVWLRVRFRLHVMLCLANVSAAMGMVLSRMLRMQMIVYSYEPHAEFQREMGLWSGRSLKYRLLKRLEEWVGHKAEYILTGTRHMVAHLQANGRKKNVFRAPTAVDERIFHFDTLAREEVRMTWGVTNDQQVVSYLGKLGGLYYERQVIELMGEMYRHSPRFFFRLATDYDQAIIRAWFDEVGIPGKSCWLTGFVPMDTIPKELSAADVGIVAVPPAPFQRFRSPTKVAEYLLCGVPYLVCRGISEDDEVAETARVGVVIADFSSRSVEEGLPNLDALLTENKETLRMRCRETGLTYRSRDRVIRVLQDIYDELAESRT